MNTALTSTITVSEVLLLIDNARDAELCRNLAESQRALSPVWPDIEANPDFSKFPLLINAELLRLSGFFLSFYGKSRNKRDFQLRGKDILTEAIRIFEQEKAEHKAAEAKVMLALCYWYSGEVSECDAVLDQVEHEFAGNQLHPVYLQIRVNRLMVLFWNQNYHEAVSIIRNLEVSMELSNDARLKTMYHNQAGLIYWQSGQMDKAVFHLNEAVVHATQANNPRFAGLNLNNLAMTYRSLGQCSVAHNYADKALDLFKSLDDVGWMPHVLDTKALIYLEEGQPNMALVTVDSALEIFWQGEDFAGLADSLWTKCLCLLRLERTYDALMVFSDLQKIASLRISSDAAERYAKNFAEQIYCPKNLPLTEEVAAYKKTSVTRALKKAGGSVVAASKLLRLKSHQALSDILNNQFPEIYDEMSIPRRKKRADAVISTKRLKKIQTHDVALVRLPEHYRFTFQGEPNPPPVQTFYCADKLMQPFGVDQDVILAVRPADDLVPGLPLLYVLNKNYYFGKLGFEEFSGLFFIQPEDANMPMPLDEVELIGVVMGYCPVDLLEDSSKLYFLPLELQ